MRGSQKKRWPASSLNLDWSYVLTQRRTTTYQKGLPNLTCSWRTTQRIHTPATSNNSYIGKLDIHVCHAAHTAALDRLPRRQQTRLNQATLLEGKRR